MIQIGDRPQSAPLTIRDEQEKGDGRNLFGLVKGDPPFSVVLF
jgi:hypothetical protein